MLPVSYVFIFCDLSQHDGRHGTKTGHADPRSYIYLCSNSGNIYTDSAVSDRRMAGDSCRVTAMGNGYFRYFIQIDIKTENPENIRDDLPGHGMVDPVRFTDVYTQRKPWIATADPRRRYILFGGRILLCQKRETLFPHGMALFCKSRSSMPLSGCFDVSITSAGCPLPGVGIIIFDNKQLKGDDIMKNASDGMNFAPPAMPKPVVGPGEFTFAAIGLDHGHIYGMSEALNGAGGTLKWVYDPDERKMESFCKSFPEVKKARSENEIFDDNDVRLVAGAAIPNERCALGIRVMDAGKDYFTDKTPMTTFEQLADAKAAVERTGKKYAVYYSERLHTETGVFSSQLIEQGAIGKVLQVLGMGPHRLNLPSRPDWFFKKEQYGGILCDIGSHQCEQILYYTKAKDAQVVRSQVANYNNPEYPELEDYGEAMLVCDNGSTGYFRIDWFTPDGLQMWGDGRTFILGTEGFIEQRKFMNIGTDDGPSHVFMANGQEEKHFNVLGKVGYPFFGQLILDCLNRTETAMTQEHAFKAAELCLLAQKNAVKLYP